MSSSSSSPTSTSNPNPTNAPPNTTSDPHSDSSSQNPNKITLALPAAPSSPQTTNLDISNGSTTVKLDHLGPIVVNVDGTMSRIANWDKMAEIEQRNTVRIISKRNKERLEVLRGKEGEGEEGKMA